ncbi:hypothetical protein K2Z83_26130 [Oscillochloris sp. ZM17-4]|uniref:hypothetical protein n=1 Tax=Oscillochloris sp. ZM17-4 TaxID=2866714 RepID=UPI001C7351F8|nr:hypothetical protein [Oscillochloris sp. ZM17-4]MBX0331132.1 hypothetical protein [Oscillochloris sp. ZM17-4]
MSFLSSPGTPYYLGAIAAAIIATWGVLLMERRRVAVAGLQLAPTAAGMSRRYLTGNLAGVPLAVGLVSMGVAGGVQGMPRLLLLAAALGGYMYLALVIPRRPLVRQQQEADALRRLTPGFISFVRVGMSSFESPLDIMRRYTLRPVTRWAPMQEVVTEALRISLDRRLRPFAALLFVVKERGCRELIDLAAALAQAEAEGGNIEAVLVAQQVTLEQILQSEFKRMLSRRTMYLLLMVAVSLVVGILINLLWVITAGGSVFQQL